MISNIIRKISQYISESNKRSLERQKEYRRKRFLRAVGLTEGQFQSLDELTRMRLIRDYCRY